MAWWASAFFLLGVGCDGRVPVQGSTANPAALAEAWRQYDELPGHLRVLGANRRRCVASLRADLNGDKHDDWVFVLNPAPSDTVYLFGAFEVEGGWKAGLIEVLDDFRGNPRLAITPPGHYETFAPGRRELEAGEKMEVDSPFAGVVLSSDQRGLPRRAFFRGPELWIHVRLEPLE